MILDEIKDFLDEDWTRTQEGIRSSLGSDITLLNATNESILSNGGKQLRPMIVLLSARACSGKASDDSINFAVASELLHNATLLHDDVADNSDKRRGKPTVMSILGSPASVLIGDFWLVKAMDNILSSKKSSHQVIRIFAKTLSDLAVGEMLQLEKAGSADTDEDDYLRIVYNKTASLFEAAAVSAAISVEASSPMTEAVREYAVDLGIAFQIRDDMFDYSDGKNIGKPVGIDLEEGKITLPLLGALAAVSPREAAAIRSKVLHVAEDPSFKQEIIAFVKTHGGIEYSRARLNEYVGKAIKALEILPSSEEKNYLARLAEFTALRSN